MPSFSLLLSSCLCSFSLFAKMEFPNGVARLTRLAADIHQLVLVVIHPQICDFAWHSVVIFSFTLSLPSTTFSTFAFANTCSCEWLFAPGSLLSFSCANFFSFYLSLAFLSTPTDIVRLTQLNPTHFRLANFRDSVEFRIPHMAESTSDRNRVMLYQHVNVKKGSANMTGVSGT